MVDAAAALAEQQLAPRRSYLAVMDELWRALRGAPGLVEYADSLTRLNRAKGMGTIMITHSLADLDALATEEDRAKARGFAERCAITVMGGLPPRELARVHEITPLTGPEAGTGHLLVRAGLLAARRPPPRPRQVPDQDGRAARASRSSSAWSAPSTPCTTQTRSSVHFLDGSAANSGVDPR